MTLASVFHALSAIKSGGRLLQFTVNMAEKKSRLLVSHVDLLRASVRHVKQQHPFVIDAMVIMLSLIHISEPTRPY